MSFDYRLSKPTNHSERRLQRSRAIDEGVEPSPKYKNYLGERIGARRKGAYYGLTDIICIGILEKITWNPRLKMHQYTIYPVLDGSMGCRTWSEDHIDPDPPLSDLEKKNVKEKRNNQIDFLTMQIKTLTKQVETLSNKLEKLQEEP